MRRAYSAAGSFSQWGAVLNHETIPTIKAAIVCGAANNQLAAVSDADLLHQRGILYVPDFICNRMGVVNCSFEVYGNFPGDPLLEQHFDDAVRAGCFSAIRF